MKNLRLSGCVTILPREEEWIFHREKGKNIIPYFMTCRKCVCTQKVWAGGHNSCFHMLYVEGREYGDFYLALSICPSICIVSWNTCEQMKSGHTSGAEEGHYGFLRHSVFTLTCKKCKIYTDLYILISLYC